MLDAFPARPKLSAHLSILALEAFEDFNGVIEAPLLHVGHRKVDLELVGHRHRHRVRETPGGGVGG